MGVCWGFWVVVGVSGFGVYTNFSGQLRPSLSMPIFQMRASNIAFINIIFISYSYIPLHFQIWTSTLTAAVTGWLLLPACGDFALLLSVWRNKNVLQQQSGSTTAMSQINDSVEDLLQSICSHFRLNLFNEELCIASIS